MIVKDNRTPRGRYEDSGGAANTYARIDSLKGFHAMPHDGMTWGSERAQVFLFKSPPRERVQRRPAERQVHIVTCEICLTPFSTVRRGVAKYCRATCRKAAYRRRHH